MMVMERAEAQAFRSAQRAQFAQFVIDTRQALADAITEDSQKMEDIIDEREASLAAALSEDSDKLNSQMDNAVEAFRVALKEIYNYNSHDFGVTRDPDTATAPYTHEQHRAFLHKFTYYQRDVLNGLDAAIANAKTAGAAQIANLVEEANDMN